MSFSVMHPIKARIYWQSLVIEHLITDYPSMRKEWNEKISLQLRQDAKSIANGDLEIEREEYSKMLDCFLSSREYDCAFYNSMLILVYAFYEDILTAIYANEGYLVSGNLPPIKDLIKSKGISLSVETQANVDYLYNKVRILRNAITHNTWNNNNIKSENKDVITKLASLHDGIICDSESLYICKQDCLLCFLEKEKSVLLELVDKLGYNKIHN